MKCSFCSMEFDADESRQGCCGCAMSSCCKKIKCPRCNYEMVPEAGLIKLIKKWREKV
ncbi:hypothetical protein [Desulfotruncus alcoholivorax]|uniref:hypothetical protein n=1 Tax=Desulfotruncus alcoholivorax TaxID=265477 RepID=UPI000428CFF6|nr:hypothetical protein [Desulfotruncus alcoholivorax]